VRRAPTGSLCRLARLGAASASAAGCGRAQPQKAHQHRHQQSHSPHRDRLTSDGLHCNTMVSSPFQVSNESLCCVSPSRILAGRRRRRVSGLTTARSHAARERAAAHGARLREAHAHDHLRHAPVRAPPHFRAHSVKSAQHGAYASLAHVRPLCCVSIRQVRRVADGGGCTRSSGVPCVCSMNGVCGGACGMQWRPCSSLQATAVPHVG
jgi:hypothetical protein